MYTAIYSPDVISFVALHISLDLGCLFSIRSKVDFGLISEKQTGLFMVVLGLTIFY